MFTIKLHQPPHENGKYTATLGNDPKVFFGISAAEAIGELVCNNPRLFNILKVEHLPASELLNTKL